MSALLNPAPPVGGSWASAHRALTLVVVAFALAVVAAATVLVIFLNRDSSAAPTRSVPPGESVSYNCGSPRMPLPC
jgi:hypothetical protein